MIISRSLFESKSTLISMSFMQRVEIEEVTLTKLTARNHTFRGSLPNIVNEMLYHDDI
jgi:hypothetical protein